MIINNNLSAMNAHRNLGINQVSQSSSMEKLSSGLRINRAGDDAAGLAISEKMRNQIRGLEQASRNAQDGISLIQTAEGALGETHSMLQRMRELSIQAQNDTYTADDRDKMDLEFQQLIKEIDGIADKTQFNDKDLLKADTSFTFHVGANAGQTISVDIDAMGAAALDIDAEGVGSSASAATALTAIDKAIELVSEQRATLGSVQNRLEHTIKNVDNTAENLQSAESNIRDTDMAAEMMKFTKYNIMSQAAQSMLAQSNQQPQQVLHLLR